MSATLLVLKRFLNLIILMLIYKVDDKQSVVKRSANNRKQIMVDYEIQSILDSFLVFNIEKTFNQVKLDQLFHILKQKRIRWTNRKIINNES